MAATGYVHSQLNTEIESISGHYVIEKETKLEYREREVLVVFGYAVIDKSCCGSGGCRFAQVPGYIVHWENGAAPDGSPVSEVEPIEAENERSEIHELIDRAEPHCQVNFL